MDCGTDIGRSGMCGDCKIHLEFLTGLHRRFKAGEPVADDATRAFRVAWYALLVELKVGIFEPWGPE